MGWRYEYEPIDGEGYIPDFWIDGPPPFYVEVKPALSLKALETELPKVQKGLAHLDVDAIIVGAKPWFEVDNLGGGAMGLVACETLYGAWHQEALWHRCLNCGRYGWRAAYGVFSGRPCGCYDGDHYLGDPDLNQLDYYWNRAGSVAQYFPRSS